MRLLYGGEMLKSYMLIMRGNPYPEIPAPHHNKKKSANGHWRLGPVTQKKLSPVEQHGNNNKFRPFFQ